MKKQMLKLLVTTALLVVQLTALYGAGVAAQTVAEIDANQSNEIVYVTGHTAPNDPVKVPLLITDAAGQAIFFTDVAGEGSPFTFQFVPSEETNKGDAVATLYSSEPIQSTFYLKPVKQDEQEKISVSFQIVGYADEEIFPKKNLKITDGASVFDLLQLASDEEDFPFEYEDSDGDGHDVYIKSIDDLAEFDKGPESGWVYRVNGKGPQAPVDRYLLEPDDEVEFIYTSDLGETEIGNNSGGSKYSKISETVSVDKALQRLRFTESTEQIIQAVEALLLDLASYDIEKQRTFIPDVGLFLQAAYERAAMIVVDKGKLNIEVVDLDGLTVRDQLKEQAEVFKELEKVLENSTLYKSLLRDLTPAIVVSIPEESETITWQIQIDVDAWKRIGEANAKIGVVRDEWRSDLLPIRKELAESKPLVYTFRFYTDQEQTTQLQGLQLVHSETPVPLTATYKVAASQSGAALVQLNWPTTGAVEDGAWPTLYTRANQTSIWKPSAVYVKTDRNKATASAEISGDALVLASTPSFEDLWELSPANSWVKEPVTALAAVGIIRGVSTTRFGLHSAVTQGEFKTLLSRIDSTETTSSTDASGLVDTQPITRAQMAVLLAKSYETSQGQTVQQQPPAFRDVSLIPAMAVDAVSLANAKEWIKGRTDGRFDPQATMTRAEAAAVLFRFWKDKNQTEKE